MTSLLREFVRAVLYEGKAKFDMEELRRAADPEEYLDFHAKKIGAGVGRVVYDSGLGYVIKLARLENERNAQQNIGEFRLGKCSGASSFLVPTVYTRDPNYRWIAVQRVKPLKPKQVDSEVKRLTDLSSLDELQDLLYWGVLKYETTPDQKRLHSQLMKSCPWYSSLVRLVKDCNIEISELHSDNWGLANDGRLVLLDPAP